VTHENCTWSSRSIGSDKLEIYPNDPNYRPGTYFIGIYANGEGMNVFTIRAYFSKRCSVTDLEDTYTANIDKWHYFKFPIKYAGNSRVEVILSPGWNVLSMFLSPKYHYPNVEEHTWSLGYYNTHDLKEESRLYDSDSKLDIDPFDVYLPRSFVRKPNYMEYSEFKRAKKKKILNRFPEGELRLCIDTDFFFPSSKYLFIGVRNLTSSSVSFNISIREVTYTDLLPVQFQSIIPILEYQYFDISGKDLSYQERVDNHLTGASELIYGDINFEHFAALIDSLKPRPGEVFWDLGSGIGKCIATVGCMYPELEVWGVEKLSSLYKLSKEVIHNLENDRNAKNMHVIDGDFRDLYWTNADIVFISDLTFGLDMCRDIENKVRELKRGARVITLKSLNDAGYLKEIRFMRVKMSWGRAGVFIYEKI
jgi:hypothetical protein